MMAKILVAGLNPAWQQVVTVPHLHGGGVNRATDSRGLAGGKGMNAAKILARAGHDVSLLQVLAGTNGDRMLDACTERGIFSLHVFCEGENRAAITVLHDGTATEIIEPFSVGDSARNPSGGSALEESLLESIPENVAYDALIICGTLPEGMDPGFYENLVGRVSCKILIWDSVVGLSEKVARRVTWLKVNAEEHRTLAPLLEKYGAAPSLLVTDGPGKARVSDSDASGTIILPTLENVVSPIGAGDTVTAMLADGLLTEGLSIRDAITRALACAMASCLQPLPADWKTWDATRIEKEIQWAP
jgi:fructose-1-phosphate kinase PfkB-like protein